MQRDAGVDFIGVGDFALYGRWQAEEARRPLTVSSCLLLLLVWLVCPPQTGRWTGSTTWDACPRGEAVSEASFSQAS